MNYDIMNYDILRKFFKKHEDNLVKDFLNAETEKEYNKVFKTWYNRYCKKICDKECNYLLFIDELLSWWYSCV